MRFRFQRTKVERLYRSEIGARDYPPEVVDRFFEVMEIIAAARDERDLYAMKSLHYEKLRGERSGDRSMRLNKQYRLTIRLESSPDGNRVLVLEIEDYH